jgi:hypothetical protein
MGGWVKEFGTSFAHDSFPVYPSSPGWRHDWDCNECSLVGRMQAVKLEDDFGEAMTP